MAKLGRDNFGQPTIPTDDFGYVNYLKSFLEHTNTMSRSTGRTTRTLGSLKKGDILIVPTPNCVRWMKEEVAKLKNLKGKRAIEKLDGIKIVYMNPRKFVVPDILHSTKGNVVFDHHWMYLHLQWRLETILEFPLAVKRIVMPKGAESAEPPVYSYSGQMWPNDTGKTKH